MAAGANPASLGRPFTYIGGGRDSTTCLHMAAAQGNLGGVRRLLDPGRVPAGLIDVNARDGLLVLTPLEIAARLDHHRVVAALIEAGAAFLPPPPPTKKIANARKAKAAAAAVDLRPLTLAINSGAYRAFKELASAGGDAVAAHRDALARAVQDRLGDSDAQLRHVCDMAKAMSFGTLTWSPTEVREGVRKIHAYVQERLA